MSLVYNKNYPLKEPAVSIDSLSRLNRIVIVGDEFFVASEPGTAERKARKLDQDCEILTPSAAAEKYPAFFSREQRYYKPRKEYVTSVKMSEKQYNFCRSHGKIGTYICGLIDNEIQKDEANKG